MNTFVRIWGIILLFITMAGFSGCASFAPPPVQPEIRCGQEVCFLRVSTMPTQDVYRIEIAYFYGSGIRFRDTGLSSNDIFVLWHGDKTAWVDTAVVSNRFPLAPSPGLFSGPPSGNHLSVYQKVLTRPLQWSTPCNVNSNVNGITRIRRGTEWLQVPIPTLGSLTERIRITDIAVPFVTLEGTIMIPSRDGTGGCSLDADIHLSMPLDVWICARDSRWFHWVTPRNSNELQFEDLEELLRRFHVCHSRWPANADEVIAFANETGFKLDAKRYIELVVDGGSQRKCAIRYKVADGSIYKGSISAFEK